jgi:omega-3 fatty acid desaturase (delta-15 desaturase)
MAPKAAKSAAPVAEAAPSVHPDGMPAIEFPSLAEIKSHLPDELFESSALRSLAYVAFDTAVIAALFLGQLALHKSAFFWYAYPVYAFMQGTMFWAYFVLGHGSFGFFYTV